MIGPPQSGKSTLFSAITGQPPDPGHGVTERLATVNVPDERLDYLAELYKPKKRTPAHLEFLDIPGVSLADAHGQAEFRKTMQTVRQCYGIVMIVRAFESDAVVPYRDRIDPKADVEELHTELIFADLEQVVTRIEKLQKSTQKPTKTRDQELRELAMMQRVQQALENEAPVANVIENDEERGIASSFGFLTLKPAIVVVNVGESDAAKPPPFEAPHAAATIALAAEIEAEISQLDEADRPTFLADYDLTEPAKSRFIHTCYDALGLISFLTAGGTNEARAWTIKKGTTAVEAAGKIHGDIQRGFIRAETVAFDDVKANKDFKGAKAAGKVRLEPKHYVVQDGDFITFRFNV
ncbi:MAG: redox-regulated ATPase YchF [Phycisphaerae bacterium]|nr:redox-regulated ATPase YchF [Phycisphaerae bacterium]